MGYICSNFKFSIRKFSLYRPLSEIYTKTSINPVNFRLSPPTNFEAKSLLLLSTPSLLTQLIEESIHLYQSNGIQVIAAGIDCVVPNSQRHGVSEMWLDEYIKINNSVKLEDRDDENSQIRERDGIHVVQASKNWKTIDSNFSINIHPDSKVDLKLANTIFSNSNLVTLFYFQPSHLNGQSNSGQTLCDLDVTLPSNLFKKSPKIESEDKWTPLYDSNSEPLIITSCTGNLVKLINKKSAAGFLEQNDRLMSIGSKDTQVFVKLYKKDLDVGQRFKVIAGGGEWGTKANILAISPEAKVDSGDRIEFFMLTPEDRFTTAAEMNNESLSNKLTFECSYEERSYLLDNMDDSIIMENVFGCGSENGFIYNNVQHLSTGERISISL
ncbi:uncharacterized protein AC631_02460 [Debaryomyces fabryi]|uniref:FIST domain-containing protein n=1 Tax=Debaryomyces fabryi TaxID=58627 RepID=A0A0V1Q014_9ASCO|nr:uncharacterized protein AC631_02460 [Debaryomyces fabryi]KSA01779.1 hypothetical protein AC631_02460 [Debaryomyces fabryi]CUM46317.1 unnamed protein product [Debaryomyces fabryi]